MPSDLRAPTTLVVLAAVALLAFGIAFARLWPFVLDDAFISARYARHLVEGHGLVYNPGERVEGYTNFLWTLLMAIPFALGLPLEAFLKVASAGFALATAIATARLAGLLCDPSPDARALRWAPALLLPVVPSFVVSAADGLETMLFAFLLTTATVRFLEEGRAPGRFPHSGWLVALLAMTRPDGAAFAGLFALAGLLERRPWRWTAAFVGLFAAAFGAYFLARAGWYGQWLPNTFYAKRGGDPWQIGRGWAEAADFAAVCGGWGWLLALPVLAGRGRRGAAWTLAAIVALRVAFQVWSGGAWMGRFRFLVPVLPMLLTLAAAGAAVAFRTPRARAVGALLLAAITLVPGWLAYLPAERGLVDYGRSLHRAQGALGARIAERTRPDAVMAMDDAGLGPLLAGRTNVDMLGLNDLHIAHLPGRFVAKFDPAYVLGRRPDLVVLVATGPRPGPGVRFRVPGHARLFAEPAFRAGYRQVRSDEFSASYFLQTYRRLDSQAVPADF